MSINWKVRFRNKVWLTAFLAFILSTVYQVLAMFDVMPAITQDTIAQVIAAVLQLLTLMGVIVDPTTKDFADSPRALGYKVPLGCKEEE